MEDRIRKLEDRTQLLEAQIAALMVATQSLLTTHPDQTRAHLEMASLLEATLSPRSPLTEQMSEKQREVMRGLLEYFGGLGPAGDQAGQALLRRLQRGR